MDKEKQIGGDEKSFVDDLFRKGMEDISPQPSEGLNTRIYRKMLWREVSTLNLPKLSQRRFFWITLMVIVISVMVLFIIPPQKEWNPEIAKKPSPVNTLNEQPAQEVTKSNTPASIRNKTYSPAALTSKVQQPVNSVISPDLNEEKIVILSGNEPESVPVASAKTVVLNEPAISVNSGATVVQIPVGHMVSVPFMPETSANGQVAPDSYLKCPQFAGRKLLWYTGLSYDIEFLFDRNTSGGFQSGNSGQVHAGLQTGNWFVETGVGFSVAPDRGNYDILYTSNDSVGFYYNIKSIIVDPGNPGQIIYEKEVKAVYDSIQHNTAMQTKNSYSYLKFPVLIGYRFYNTSRFSVSAVTGGEIMLLLSRKEPFPEFQSPNGTVNEVTSVSPVRGSTCYNVVAGFRATYKPSGTISILLEPDFRYYIQAYRETGSATVNQPWSVGLRVGVLFSGKR
jgi:hypothetical protein